VKGDPVPNRQLSIAFRENTGRAYRAAPIFFFDFKLRGLSARRMS